jgi:predicted restriction endonuclease
MNKETRKFIHEKYNGHCAYCGIKMTIKEMQVDHLVIQTKN